jgi:hypothetical protein
LNEKINFFSHTAECANIAEFANIAENFQQKTFGNIGPLYISFQFKNSFSPFWFMPFSRVREKN